MDFELNIKPSMRDKTYISCVDMRFSNILLISKGLIGIEKLHI